MKNKNTVLFIVFALFFTVILTIGTGESASIIGKVLVLGMCAAFFTTRRIHAFNGETDKAIIGYLLLPAICQLIGHLGFPRSGLVDFLLYIIGCAFTALYEELYFRAIGSELLKDLDNSTRTVILLAVPAGAALVSVFTGSFLGGVIGAVEAAAWAFTSLMILKYTGNLLNCVIAHFIYNVASGALCLGMEKPLLGNFVATVLSLAAIVLLAATGYYVMGRINSKAAAEAPAEAAPENN